MHTSVRRSYQYYDYTSHIDFNNARNPLVLQLDQNLAQEPEHQHLHQYQTIEQHQQQQPLFQQNQFHQLPVADNQLNVHQHEQQQAPIGPPEPSQNFECFLEATKTATCYSVGTIQPQLDSNSTAQILSEPTYDDSSIHQCQLLNSHVVFTVDQNDPNLATNGSNIGSKQETLQPNLYHQEINNETTTNQAVFNQQTPPTLYYDPSLLDSSNCGQLEQNIELPSYHTSQLVAAAPTQQISTTDSTCDYFHFQPIRQTHELTEHQQQVQLIHPQDTGKFSTFGHAQPINELSPNLQELFQPVAIANSFDTNRFLIASHPLNQQQQHQENHFQDQTRVADIQHYQGLIKQPEHGGCFSYLESETLERRQTFEPSLASQEETQSSSSSSISSSEESASSILTRDEKKAREANIPLAYSDIINLSIEQFNEQLSKYNLSESQLNLIKDIRRRGKNKVAAQSCRKRKMEQICELQNEVEHLSTRRKSLENECNQLVETHDRLARDYDKTYSTVQEYLAARQQQSQGILIT